MNPSLKISCVEPVRSIPQKRRSALFWMAFEVRTVFPVCVVEKVSPPTCTMAGEKISWKQVRNVLWEIPSEKPAPMKWYDLKKENQHLKQLVAEITLKNRVLKKSLTGMDSEDIDL